MTSTLVFSSEFLQHAERVDTWWRQHRAAAPDLFADELDRALSLIVEHPELGRSWPRPGYPALRRLELRRSRYYVLYEPRPTTNEIYVDTVWSAVRGRGPRLDWP